MRIPRWTPCIVAPDDFDCSECELAYAHCDLRTDDALRDANATRHRLGGSEEVTPNEASRIYSIVAEVLHKQQISMPISLLAELAMPSGGEDTRSEQLARLLRASPRFAETSPGMFRGRVSEDHTAVGLLSPLRPSSGRAIELMLADYPALSRPEQIRGFKRLAGLTLAASFTDQAEAEVQLEALLDTQLHTVAARRGWALSEMLLLAQDGNAVPIDKSQSPEELSELHEVLSALTGLDLLHGTSLAVLRLQRAELWDRLMLTNTRLVGKIGKRYARGGFLTYADVFQEGMFGLSRAIEKFNPYRGFQFSTYATWWIRQGITRAVADQEATIRLPVHVQEQVHHFKTTANSLRERGLAVSYKTIAADLAGQQTAEKVEELLNASHAIPPLVDHLLNQIPDADSVDDRLLESTKTEAVRMILEKLSPREAYILELRFGLVDGDAHTLERIGRKMGVTRERVRQLQRKALKKLQGADRLQELRSMICEDPAPNPAALPSRRLREKYPRQFNSRQLPADIE